ncbi:MULTISPECIES: TIGR03752 family integrating conjugative element protein [unclassified Pseudomonas]|uniref:TIGR03752 family integrating conjugative element protein n=1 Tax=unclassified Pseudomonas TaxID=196821 RepID=UPI00128C7759|nr:MULTISPECIES: TIGR03752 family integrating conjugative element protein [unclassified Pseudomonas]MPQ69547.1 TIGR03752 family integrating conjugative element protein [Pseudomonas sp. MWU12-2323]
MTSNGLLKWLLLPLILLVVFGVIKACSPKDVPAAKQVSTGQPLTPEDMKQLGIDGDTPHDTVATLVAQTKAMRAELKALLTENKDQQKENARLRQRDSDIDQRIQKALNTELEKAQPTGQQRLSPQDTQNLLEDLKQQLSTSFLSKGGADLPIGLGLEPGDETSFPGAHTDLVWTEPQDATAVDAKGQPLPAGSGKPAKGFSFPTAFSDEINKGQRALKANTGAVGRNIKTTDDKTPAKPVYTLPENSTLTGSIAMTALIGRVPVDGVVNDPYPFKVLIGPDNLTANGIDLPDVAGAVISGTAAGDWTLSCVRGQIVSLTFVFNDGRIRTLPAPQKLTSRQSSGQAGQSQLNKIQGGIGWLSDPYGVPCIAGERRSNAQQYLGTKSLLTAAGAGMAKLLEADKADVSTLLTPGGAAVGAGPSALNSILSGGVKDIGDWVNKLYGQAFAAVYVQPGASVAVHLDRQLEIDYETLGRQVRHVTGGHHASTLD